MSYDSQIDVIWAKLVSEGSPRRPTTSRTSFENIVTVFTQAENGTYSGTSSSEVATFRAEYNIWAYYFGEVEPFPGLDPVIGQMVTVSSPAAVPPLSGEAADMQEQIQTLWVGRWNRLNYQPQMGWNPETGEPWMAIRAYAANSYPALSGSHNCYLKALERENPEFVVQYERFPHVGYTLLWPEFANAANLKNQAAWKRFNQFRAFLSEWSSIIGTAPHVNDAFEDYRSKFEDERPQLPVPLGFVPNIDQMINDSQGRALPHRSFKRVRPRREDDRMQRNRTVDRFSSRRGRAGRRRSTSRTRDGRYDRFGKSYRTDRVMRSRSDSPRSGERFSV